MQESVRASLSISKLSVSCLEKVAMKCVSKFLSSKKIGPLIRMLFPSIGVYHVSKAWLTFRTYKCLLYQCSDEVLNVL